LEAPLLNPEIAAQLYESAKTRDVHLAGIQNCVGSAIAAVGSIATYALESIQTPKILEDSSEGSPVVEDNYTALVSCASDAGRLITDVLHQLSVARREQIIPKIKEKLYKTVLQESKSGKFLFGDGLTDKMKEAKATVQVGRSLFMGDGTKPKPTGNDRRLQPLKDQKS